MLFILVSLLSILFAQKYRSNRYSRLNNDNYISMSFYTTPLPYSVGGKIGYNYSFRESTYISAELAAEKGRPFELKYQYIGTDISISYSPFDMGRSIYVYLKGGGTAGYDMISEKKESNSFLIGGKVGVEANYYIQDNLAIGGFFNQGMFMKSNFGNKRIEYGLNFKISLGW